MEDLIYLPLDYEQVNAMYHILTVAECDLIKDEEMLQKMLKVELENPPSPDREFFEKEIDICEKLIRLTCEINAKLTALDKRED